MRRILKNNDSEIIKRGLNYIEGNSYNNLKISKILYKEQKGFCVYTEEYLGRADARDIEHFNPNFKGTDNDSYSNWFLVKHLCNSEKSTKWFEQILLPTNKNFEKRIVYDKGDYRISDANDIEAINLIKLIKLDDLMLADERKKYINRKRNEIENLEFPQKTFFRY